MRTVLLRSCVPPDIEVDVQTELFSVTNFFEKISTFP